MFTYGFLRVDFCHLVFRFGSGRLLKILDYGLYNWISAVRFGNARLNEKKYTAELLLIFLLILLSSRVYFLFVRSFFNHPSENLFFFSYFLSYQTLVFDLYIYLYLTGYCFHCLYIDLFFFFFFHTTRLLLQLFFFLTISFPLFSVSSLSMFFFHTFLISFSS